MCDPTALPSIEQTDRDPLWLVRCSCQQPKDLQCAGELKSESCRAENDSDVGSTESDNSGGWQSLVISLAVWDSLGLWFN